MGTDNINPGDLYEPHVVISDEKFRQSDTTIMKMTYQTQSGAG
jgi:hypothetical protein